MSISHPRLRYPVLQVRHVSLNRNIVSLDVHCAISWNHSCLWLFSSASTVWLTSAKSHQTLHKSTQRLSWF